MTIYRPRPYDNFFFIAQGYFLSAERSWLVFQHNYLGSQSTLKLLIGMGEDCLKSSDAILFTKPVKVALTLEDMLKVLGLL